MSSSIGKTIRISIFGESHSAAIGVSMDGLPAGERIDEQKVLLQMSRRAPGNDKSATPRKESDTPHIISGLLNGVTTGAPLCAIIENNNIRSGDYSNLVNCPRPSHADYPASVKYGGFNDLRGSGHFSGRLTAPLTFAGGVCRQILERRGITVGGHLFQIGSVYDTAFDMAGVSAALLDSLSARPFSVISPEAENEMRAEIEHARMDLDSIGGIVEIAAVGLPTGAGEPMFDGIESVLSTLIFGIPAVKGLEFGAGFGVASMRGSECNDLYFADGDKIKTHTNNNGGILGGITNGMPLILRAAIKPTPSIAKPQQTLNLSDMQQTELVVNGRHDPCIAPRALPAVEAAVCIGLCDIMKEGGLL